MFLMSPTLYYKLLFDFIRSEKKIIITISSKGTDPVTSCISGPCICTPCSRLFDIFTAAVAFIVSAGTVVVLVVAVAIANVIWNRAFGFAAFDSVLGILALALFAVSCLDLSALDRFRTAVASIEFAATVVVLVVAVAVALVLLETAFSFTVFIFLVVRVLAFALLAVGFFEIFTAAVTFIESAGTVVVIVVAVAIANVLWN